MSKPFGVSVNVSNASLSAVLQYNGLLEAIILSGLTNDDTILDDIVYKIVLLSGKTGMESVTLEADILAVSLATIIELNHVMPLFKLHVTNNIDEYSSIVIENIEYNVNGTLVVYFSEGKAL